MSRTAIFNRSSPVLRSAVAIHAAIGLTSVLAAIAFAGTAAGAWFWLPAILMGLVLVDSWMLKRRLGSCLEIDRRLAAIADCRSVAPRDLQLLPEVDESSAGWNRLIRSASVQQLVEETDARLEEHPTDQNASVASHVLSVLPDGLLITEGPQGCVFWSNDAAETLIGCDAAAETSTLIDRVRHFAGVASVSHLISDHQTVAPIAFELMKGPASSDGVLRFSRHCLSESEPAFLWTIRDVTQQRLTMEARDMFVTAATHELRTPLCNIRAYGETLAADEAISPIEQRKFLNVILSEAARLERIIEDLLNIGQMKAGSLTLDRSETQIERLLREAQEKIKPLVDVKHMTLELDVPPRLPDLIVDKNKLVAAIVNLLGNAVKYTPEGGRVRLFAEHDGRDVRIHVEDTGFGISAEELPHLFERFYRSADPRVADIQGTGLGLSFVHDIVRLHGGRVDVTSELNKGSRFTMVLPSTLARSTPG